MVKAEISVFVGLLFIVCYLKQTNAISEDPHQQIQQSNAELKPGGSEILSNFANARLSDAARKSKTINSLQKINADRHVADAFRSRRSPSVGVKYNQPKSASAEMQTIMSGNWHGMDPTSLYRLLTSLASSREVSMSLPQHDQDDFYAYDDSEEDEAPIDLVYSGKKPLALDSSSSRLPLPLHVATPKTSEAMAIPLMSSNVRNIYKVADDLEDDPQPLHLHKLSKKRGFPLKIFSKRSHFRSNWPLGDQDQAELQLPVTSYHNRRDLVQLPNGEIAFTPRGIHVLQYQPVSFSLPLEDNLPVIRRPIL